MNLADPGIGKTLRRQLDQMGVADQKAERRALLAGARVLKAEIRSQLRRSGRGAPSEPGETPARQSGELLRSIGHQFRGRKLRVGTGLIRAKWLEFGHLVVVGGRRTRAKTAAGRLRTSGKGRAVGVVAPRPFMRPALTAAKGQMGPVAAGELRQGRGTRV